MKILFVGMADQIHTARWIRQLDGTGWDCHLFPTEHGRRLNPELHNVTVHSLFRSPQVPDGVREKVFLPWPFVSGRTWIDRALSRRRIDDAFRLARIIRRIQPDIVHSLGIHVGGFNARDARRLLGGRFPRWLVSNQGIDIHYWGRFAEYAGGIREVLSSCDEYLCECARDLALGREFGFEGKAWPVLPQAGGLDLGLMAQLRERNRPSERRLILVKGYQHFYGRALVALKAIELCAPMVVGYRVALSGVSGDDVALAAREVERRTGIAIEIIPRSSHQHMLELQAQARLSLSLSITDGACMTFLEAIAAGAFPVQSNTACSSEWTTDGEGALFVDPDDPHDVAAAVRRALTDDALVDRAAQLNWNVVVAGLDRDRIRAQVIEGYRAP